MHITMLAYTVVSLAEGDARHTAGDSTSADGREAAEEALRPWAGIVRRISSHMLGISEGLVEATDPFVHILLVDGSGLLGGGRVGVVRSHCEVGCIVVWKGVTWVSIQMSVVCLREDVFREARVSRSSRNAVLMSLVTCFGT